MSLPYAEQVVLLGSVAAIYAAAWLTVKRAPELAERWGLSLDGLTIIWRTERLNRFIERVGGGHPRLFGLIGDAAIAVGAALLAYGIYFLHVNLLNLAARAPSASPVAPVIPGVTIGLDSLPYFLFAAFLVLVPHELMHAFVAAAERVPVKSTGIFLMLILPGGFAEIDEEELSRRSLRTQARIFSAGSLANIATFLVIIALLPALVFPVGVRVEGTLQGYPAEAALKPGDVLVAINGEPIRTFADLSRVLSSYKPGDTVVLTVLRGGREVEVSITLAENPRVPGRGFIGAYFAQAFNSDVLYNLLWWSAVFTSSVAVINMLPIYPLDGGRVLDALLRRRLGEERGRPLTYIVTAYFVGTLLLNMLFSFSIFGLRVMP